MGDDSGMLESLDRAGRSPLHYAALEGDVDAADQLIAKGLEPVCLTVLVSLLCTSRHKASVLWWPDICWPWGPR